MKNYVPYQSQYYRILSNLFSSPRKTVKTRVGDAQSLFVEQMCCDLSKEFPIQNIKQMSLKNIYVELLWFLKGLTNIYYLVNNNCNIWNDDAYRWYKDYWVSKGAPSLSKEEFIEKVKHKKQIVVHDEKKNADVLYVYGDLGYVYGFQWRNFAGNIDQLNDVINKLKTDPDDRRLIITAHNPADLHDGYVALPSCHNYIQFYSQPQVQGKRRLSVFFNMRSADFFLGVPYNMASYSILLMMVSQIVDMDPGEVVCNMVDCHLYTEHMQGAETWLSRFESINVETPNSSIDHFLCKGDVRLTPITENKILNINDYDESSLKIDNYTHMGKITVPLLT